MGSAEVWAGMGLGLFAFILMFVILMIPNTLVLWFVVKMQAPDAKEKTTLWRCFLCVLCLQIVTIIIAVLYLVTVAFIPLGIILLIVFFFAWIVASKATIEGFFEITDGSGGILFFYIVINAVLGPVLKDLLSAL